MRRHAPHPGTTETLIRAGGGGPAHVNSPALTPPPAAKLPNQAPGARTGPRALLPALSWPRPIQIDRYVRHPHIADL